MIDRLELRRWRAFDHVAVDFQPGTTFLVAPNGVGKTSLLLGLTWALFGEHSGVDASTCVRLGHDNAEATVTLTIDGRQLVIVRAVTMSGKTTARYLDGDHPIDEAAAQQLLETSFGAPIEIAARLAVIRGPRDDAELQLREHLYDAFGVSGLRRAAAAAAKLHKDAVAARKQLRSATRSRLSNRGQVAALADKLRTDLSELAARRAPLAQAVSSAISAQQAVAAWSEHDAASSERAQAIEDLLDNAAEHGLSATDLSELTEVVSAARLAALARSDQLEDTLDEARAQVFAARTALTLLEAHDPSCPTCARPFQGDELGRAVAAQNDSLRLAEGRIAEATAELERLTDESAQAADIRSEAQRLSEPIPEPTFERPTGDPDAAAGTAQEAVRRHDELVGGIAAELDALVTQLDDDDEIQAAYAAERTAWRREALTQAAFAAFTGTAERLATQYIEPLSQQVRWRWKALFGEDGLQLRPDGTIVRVVGDRELPWNQLSSGEQIWAQLVASLLVLRSSTTLPFAWLDEPLEHLDPRARRIVATDLATSTLAGRPAQMIVTTYEHTLARQLAEDLPNTHLRQILRTDVVETPPRRRADRPAPDGDGPEGTGEQSPAA